ncbi:type II toxin-antitoxin system RelE/ParE family toxin [Candidatus Accumulibacter sp. ACC007]|uniref:type II toxin-antitoxin system RelE/ParE family toxin n=1 Tax=Candidatus Accumulibacter sp. ACC007 TaxID=2823333 RepID=UPI0025BC0953|nr:type II toxin-antitoxin system RelE/ParE family toxin [Candidatus Accumulibacter sp. ACC007]
MRLEFSPESPLDLLDIAAFIAQDNPARAKSFVDELEADCGRLITQSGIGAPRPENC